MSTKEMFDALGLKKHSEDDYEIRHYIEYEEMYRCIVFEKNTHNIRCYSLYRENNIPMPMNINQWHIRAIQKQIEELGW